MSIEGIIIGLLAILIGAAFAFYGLKLFTILLPIWAFFFGLLVGAQLGQEILGEGFFGTIVSWVIGVIFGVLFAGISYFFYYGAIVLLAGSIGYSLGVGLMAWLGIDASILGIIVGLIVGALFAIGTLLTGVPVLLIMVLSAFGGAAAIVNGVLLFLGRIQLEDLNTGLVSGLLTDSFIGVAAWVVIAAVALAYQFRDVGSTITSLDRSTYRY